MRLIGKCHGFTPLALLNDVSIDQPITKTKYMNNMLNKGFKFGEKHYKNS